VAQRLEAARLAVNWEVVIYVGLMSAAFALRFWDLGGRALHHDESIHGQWSWGLIQGNYRHSPIFHGPLYYHVQGLVFLLIGAADYTARVSAALFGTALVALPLLLRRRLGAAGTIAAVALIAFSPTLVYYSRFFREDIYMAFFTLLMVVGIWRYIEGGQQRWLFVAAAAFTGGVLTKEGAFLVVAVFLLYLDLYLATQLAAQTLSARQIDTADRRAILAGALAPWAWALAALWPFIGPIKRRMDWEELPRSGDLVILLGTLTLPLLTPVSRHYFLEPLGLIDKDRLSWEKSLQGTIATRDAVALSGLFAVTTSLAAFAGLQWRPRLWAIAFGSCGLVYLTLMTSFWTNMNGLVSGPWGSLDYWVTQQDVARGDQPWFYYYMLMPMYEFLPLVLALGGLYWAVVRGDAFSRFLVVWSAGMWLVLSYAAEKMPWNNTHIALPVCLLAAWTVQRAWRSWGHISRPRPVALGLASVAFLSMGALALIIFLPSGASYGAVKVGMFVIAVGLIGLTAYPYGRKAPAPFLVAAVVGALALFSVRTMVMVTFVRADDPRDLLIYTQSSPQLATVAHEIDQLAAASGKGERLAIAVDSTDSFAWPWAWYLRDYKAVSYVDFTNGPPVGQFDVLLVNQSNVSKVNDALAAGTATQYGAPIKYAHRWWYDETYKTVMQVEGKGACTGLGGNCGPFRPATWERIGDGLRNDGWLTAWYDYWRDHDPGRPNGSVDAYAYFPAIYDLAKGTLSARPLEAPKPGVDKSGRPTFGGVGTFPGQFFAPVDVETDVAGNLYVIDSATKKLQKFDAQGNFLAAVDIRANPTDLNEQSQPWGLTIGPNGDIVVADTFGWRLRVFDKDLKPIGGFGQAPDTTKAPGPFDLFGPRDGVIDSQGNLWVTDTGNDRIQVYTLGGQYVRTVGSSGSGPGQFDEPVGLSIGPDGAIYVADMFNRRVEVLNPDGSFRSQFPVEGWGGQEVNDKPYLRVLKDGRVAVSLPALNVVRIYNSAGAVVGTINPTDEPLSRPYGIVETAGGKLWVVEGGSGRLRLFDIP
jgi:uncharacterized protein (TIGR03663 family)